MNRTRATAAGFVSLSLGGCSWARLPAGATTQAGQMHLDWVVFFYAGLGVFVVVAGLIVFALLAWRRRSDALPPQFRRNGRVEVVATAIPLVMIVLLFALTYRVESSVERLAGDPAAVVDVLAFRWSWRFSYPGQNVRVIGTPQRAPEMVIPVNATTRINLTSVDVNHAFWVPAFLFKRDAIAGMTNSFDWHPDRLGSFPGRCAEFCGLDHALMTFSVRVVSQAEFRRWLLAHRGQQP